MPPLARTLATDADFVLAVLAEGHASGALTWDAINRLAARTLRPEAGADTSRRGHAVVIEMLAHGLFDAELTTAADGALMVRTARARPASAHAGAVLSSARGA